MEEPKYRGSGVRPCFVAMCGLGFGVVLKKATPGAPSKCDWKITARESESLVRRARRATRISEIKSRDGWDSILNFSGWVWFIRTGLDPCA